MSMANPCLCGRTVIFDSIGTDIWTTATGQGMILKMDGPAVFRACIRDTLYGLSKFNGRHSDL